MTVGLVNPDNFESMYGNVTGTCMTNGSYYTEVLCGPRGSESLSYNVWKTRYPRGYQIFDIDLVQSYASEMLQRGEQLGGAAGGQTGQMAIATGEAWFYRDQTLPANEQAAKFHYMMCRMWRESDAGALADESPQMHSKFASGSIASITSSWAFETCKRFKHEVFGDISRAIHNFALEVAMCFEDPVECKKEFEHCLGSCAGDSTSTLHYDFATMIAISDLNPDVVGTDGFDAAHANCTVKTGVVEVELFEGGDS